MIMLAWNAVAPSRLLPPILQEQGILHAEAVEGGGAKLYITLLAAGFIIGALHAMLCACVHVYPAWQGWADMIGTPNPT
jgi:hypothetical protein